MSYFYLTVNNISRQSRQPTSSKSVAGVLAYINGKCLFDSYLKKHRIQQHRNDIIANGILLPENVPEKFRDLQTLANELNAAEIRKDARMAQSIIMSLPNALPQEDYPALIEEFCFENFVKNGRCVSYVIHSGEKSNKTRSRLLPSAKEREDNPHAHLVVPCRPMDADGFCKTKIETQKYSSKASILNFRKSWADLQNLALERAGIDVRVSHLSLKEQGIDKIPRARISAKAYALEQKGIPTLPGQKYIETLLQNETDECKRQELQDILRKREQLLVEHERRLIEQARIQKNLVQAIKCSQEQGLATDIQLIRTNECTYSNER